MSSTEKTTAPYGSWKSPITTEVASYAEKRLSGIAVAEDGRLVWIDPRPEERGYAILLCFQFKQYNLRIEKQKCRYPHDFISLISLKGHCRVVISSQSGCVSCILLLILADFKLVTLGA